MSTQSQLDVKELFPPLARTANANGVGVDLQGYINPGKRSMKAFLGVNTVSGTTPTLDVKMQESDVLGSGYTDITGATFVQVTAAGNSEIHFMTNKRYVRAVGTVGGTTPNFLYGAYLLAERRYK